MSSAITDPQHDDVQVRPDGMPFQQFLTRMFEAFAGKSAEQSATELGPWMAAMSPAEHEQFRALLEYLRDNPGPTIH